MKQRRSAVVRRQPPQMFTFSLLLSLGMLGTWLIAFGSPINNISFAAIAVKKHQPASLTMLISSNGSIQKQDVWVMRAPPPPCALLEAPLAPGLPEYCLDKVLFLRFSFFLFLFCLFCLSIPSLC